MGFILGLLTGIVVGAVGAVMYSVQTGRDLREAYDEIVKDLGERDFEALGARLEARFTEMQTQIEAKLAQAREKASEAAGEVGAAAEAAAGEAAVGEGDEAAGTPATEQG